jgi:selenide, water dikinase
MARDRRVLVDHATLDDAGVYAWGRGEALVQTADFFTPVVDDPYDYGQVAAANAVSDVYAMGGRPLTALALLCVPEHTLPEGTVREILRGGQDKLREAGVSILGGHTVVDPELKFGYAVTGVVKRRRILANRGARRGDLLILTKPLGSGILATALKQQRLEAPQIARLTKVMATLNRAASEVAVAHGAHAATDVTGYGLLGHGQQMADASGVSFVLRPSPKWLMPRALELAEAGVGPAGQTRNREFYSKGVDEGAVPDALLRTLYDPQTSGGLLIALPARRTAAALQALKRRKIWVAEVGEVTARRSRAVALEA